MRRILPFPSKPAAEPGPYARLSVSSLRTLMSEYERLLLLGVSARGHLLREQEKENMRDAIRQMRNEIAGRIQTAPRKAAQR